GSGRRPAVSVAASEPPKSGSIIPSPARRGKDLLTLPDTTSQARNCPHDKQVFRIRYRHGCTGHDKMCPDCHKGSQLRRSVLPWSKEQSSGLTRKKDMASLNARMAMVTFSSTTQRLSVQGSRT